MRMLKRFSLVALAVVLLGLGLLTALHETPAQAATVIGYQTVTILDGATAYTETLSTDGYAVGSFGEVLLQVHSDISGTGNITITPQFSSQPGGCGAVTDWADATASTTYVNATGSTITDSVSALAYGVVEISVVVVDDDATLLRLPTAGRCLRVQIETAETVTPTVYAWMVNTQ